MKNIKNGTLCCKAHIVFLFSLGKVTERTISSIHLSNFIGIVSTEQPKMHSSTKRGILSRLLRLTPLILVVVGSVLTIIGNTVSLKGCKIAGPVAITAGALLLLFITLWSSRQGQLTENANCEEAQHYANRTVRGEGSANDQLGPIHHFEIKIPSETSGTEIVPPSYEEAVKSNDTESSHAGEVVPCDGKELNSENTNSAPPSYEESHVNAK